MSTWQLKYFDLRKQSNQGGFKLGVDNIELGFRLKSLLELNPTENWVCFVSFVIQY